jgi:four helix bundle protein
MSSWNSFEEIEVWQMARAFCQEVDKIGQKKGLKEDFSLKDQINRSSGSVMDNIVEGYERGGNKEFIYFLAIAKGSAGEARSQLYRIFDKKYISKEEFDTLKTQVLNISGKLANLIKYLKSSDLKGPRYK